MPNDTFQEWFCLKNRATFTIDPKVNPDDAKLYFGRDTLRDRIKKQVSRAFIDPQVPKMMFYGAYGSGKTQTLYHMAWDMSANKPTSCKGPGNFRQARPASFPLQIDASVQTFYGQLRRLGRRLFSRKPILRHIGCDAQHHSQNCG